MTLEWSPPRQCCPFWNCNPSFAFLNISYSPTSSHRRSDRSSRGQAPRKRSFNSLQVHPFTFKFMLISLLPGYAASIVDLFSYCHRVRHTSSDSANLANPFSPEILVKLVKECITQCLILSPSTDQPMSLFLPPDLEWWSHHKPFTNGLI